MRISPGMTIAGFRLDELIGEGGMGVVYKAFQLDLERVVALKLIQPGLSEDAEFRARFRRESKLGASIDHPNIVPIFQAGDEGGVYFIAMRYVEGTDLGAYLRGHGGPLEPLEAARIVAEVADGLDAAHAAGLVHRDVKPANILLDARRRPYLTDFGLTKQISSQSLNTKTGLWIGSINYSAPEQIEGETVDARTDVYSLGCVLFETLTDELPYARDTEMALMWAKVHKQPRLPLQINPSLPPAFDQVIARALARHKEDRYGSSGDLGRAAVAAAHGLAEPAPAPERTVARGAAMAGYKPTQATLIPEPQTQAMRRRSTRNHVPVMAAVAALAVIAALVAVALARTGSSDGSSTGKTTASVGGPRSSGKSSSGTSSGAPQSSAESTESEETAAAEEEAASEEATASSQATPPSRGPASAAPLEEFQGRLYAAQVPAGWTPEDIEVHQSGYYESKWLNPDDSHTSVLIDSEVHRTDTTPLEDAEGVRSEADDSNGYREIAFEPTTLAGLPAARWVFEVEEDRRVDYFVISCDIGLAVLGSTSPTNFGGWAPTFHAVANSITTVCE